jgi:hypothetical protein
MKKLAVSCIILLFGVKTSSCIAVEKFIGKQIAGFEGCQVFCRLEAVALRSEPTDGASQSEDIITFNEKLTALQQWRGWVLVRKNSSTKHIEGWVKLWHISPVELGEKESLTDLRRIQINEDESGKMSVLVEGDVYFRVPIAMGDKRGTLAAKKCIFMSECRHYFFDITASKTPSFLLRPDERFTPEKGAIYQIKNQRPVKIGVVTDSSALSGSLHQEDPTAHRSKLGIVLYYNEDILGTNEAYGFVWIDKAYLGTITKGTVVLLQEHSLHFRTKVYAVSEIPSYIMVEDAESGKSGWIHSKIVCGPSRIGLLEEKKVIPKALTIAVEDHDSGEVFYEVVGNASINNRLSKWVANTGDCITFNSQRLIDSLKKDGRLPDGLSNPEPKKIYLCVQSGQFEHLP